MKPVETGRWWQTWALGRLGIRTKVVTGTIFLLVFSLWAGDRTVGFNVMAERWDEQAGFFLAVRKNGD